MNTRFLVASVLAVAIASLTVACDLAPGCDPDVGQNQAALTLTDTTIEATRTPSTCGVADPPFTSQDSFALEIVGGVAGAKPTAKLTLTLTANVAIGVAVPLVVDSTGAGATSQDGTIDFQLSLGSDDASLDDSGLGSAVITVDALPTKDGQPLLAEVQLYFDDGNELDQTFRAAVASAVRVCPAGVGPT